jgi:hypothetical protein
MLMWQEKAVPWLSPLLHFDFLRAGVEPVHAQFFLGKGA